MRFYRELGLEDSANPLGGVSQNEYGEGRYILHNKHYIIVVLLLRHPLIN
jgi:hypothetical protein